MGAAEFTRMRRWSRWMSAWTILSVPGLCLAVIAPGPRTMVAMAAVLSVPLGLTLIMLRHDRRQRQTPPTGPGWSSRIVLCATALFVSTAGIAATVPGLAFLVVLVAFATAPPTIDLRHRAFGGIDSAHIFPTSAEAPAGTTAGATSREQPLTREPRGEDARKMTDRQLCQAWRHSYWSLKEARDPIEKLRLVEQRTRFLDELEARNAAALGAWLASGARACDGPDKFFNDDERDQPTAA